MANKQLSIQSLSLISVVKGAKAFDAVADNLCATIIKRTAKTCGVNGSGGLAFVKETNNYFQQKGNKTSSYTLKGVLSALEVLNEQGVIIGKDIQEGKKPSKDVAQLHEEVMTAYNNAIDKDKAEKQAKKEAKDAETAKNEQLTEEALQAQATAEGAQVVEAFDLNDDDVLIVNGDGVTFGALKNAYITMQAQALINNVQLDNHESEVKQAA